MKYRCLIPFPTNDCVWDVKVKVTITKNEKNKFPLTSVPQVGNAIKQ